MELRWWPIALAGLLCLALAVAAAISLPMSGVQRRLRPLAHVERLTRLPEYARMMRWQLWSTVTTGVLLLIVFLAAVLASSRPAGLPSTSRDVDAVHAEDVMLCVAEPATDATTATFLDYFAEKTTAFGSQRIGLTSPSLRVVPLTGDHQYAADQFSRYAKLAALQRDLDARKQMTPGQVSELRTGVENFSRPLDYVDYARSVADVLALCLAGFPPPDAAAAAAHRRSLIYLGASDIRDPDDRRLSLFSAQRVQDMAAAAGVQVNVVDVITAPSPQSADLHAIAVGTGGTFEVYEPGGTDPALTATLDRIRANPPHAVPAAASASHPPEWDTPDVPLIVGIVVAALLCLSLAVLRR